jgi:hypothetical protein
MGYTPTYKKYTVECDGALVAIKYSQTDHTVIVGGVCCNVDVVTALVRQFFVPVGALPPLEVSPAYRAKYTFGMGQPTFDAIIDKMCRCGDLVAKAVGNHSRLLR